MTPVFGILAFVLLLASGLTAMTGWPLGVRHRDDNALPIILLVLAICCAAAGTFVPPVAR